MKKALTNSDGGDYFEVFVHNNRPAYSGASERKAREAYDAEVARTQDGVGASEIIELVRNGKTIAKFVPG